MQKHTKIYLNTFGYSDTDTYIPCEICEAPATDTHHIIGRGKKGKDSIENLMAVCRKCHTDYGDRKDYMLLLFQIHKKRMINAGVKFDNDWIEKQIKKYE